LTLLSQKRALEILEKGKPGDKVSIYSDICLSSLIILNLLAVSVESVSSIGDRFSAQFFIFEMFSVSVFSCEYLLRIWASAAVSGDPSSSSIKKRLKYIFSFTGIIDLLAILPSLLPLLFTNVDLRWLRVLRLLRLLKISHYSTALEDLFSAINHEKSSFAAASYLFVLALFFASSMMYVAENSVQPEVFSSIPETMWWALITLTTVGYGDVSPISPLGKVIGAFTAIMGVFSVALLTGIVANAFAHQVAQRKAILEAEIAQALMDGEIDFDEEEKIEILRKRFDMSEEHVNAITNVLREKAIKDKTDVKKKK
jgi:voltage-gated potassium channel